MTTRVTTYLGSLRCTLHLTISLVAIFLAGFFVPQKSIIGRELYRQWEASSPLLFRFADSLRLTDIYAAPYTVIIWCCFFLNLTLVMQQRVPLVLKKINRSDDSSIDPYRSYFQWRRVIPISEGTELRVPLLLTAAGYRFRGTPAQFSAVKNRLSPLATILFHLSFFLILFGGVLIFYTRFSGFVDLSEGESFQGETGRYNASPRLPRLGLPAAPRFTVESVRPEVVADVATDIKVALRDSTGKSHLLEINRPYKEGHTSVLFNDLGIAPLFVMEDGAGKELDGAYVKLKVLKGQEDSFTMMGYRVAARYFPDHVVENGEDRSRSEEFRNPAFHLTVYKNKVRLAANTIHPGEALAFDGMRLIFRQQSFWVRFLVVKEYGLEFVYAGFALASIALIWRLIFFRREIVGIIEETDNERLLVLAARAEFYSNLSRDEFDRITAPLASMSPAPGGGDLPAEGTEGDEA